MRRHIIFNSILLSLTILLTVAAPSSALAKKSADTKQPFQTQMSLNLADGISGANAAVTIPSGKRLVIQYASAWAQTPSGQTVTFTIQTMLNDATKFTPHYLPAVQQNSDAINEIFIAGTAVHLYADAPQVMLRVDRGSVITGAVIAYISISGYLIDQ